MSLFKELSIILGLDIDKIIINKDEKEIKKMNKKLLKESIIIRTNAIRDDVKID